VRDFDTDGWIFAVVAVGMVADGSMDTVCT
jgi:hypothetical protein